MANQTTPAIQIKDSNVGIGTASPTRQLELVGTDAYIQLTRSSTSTQATLGFNTGATNDWLIRTGDGSTSNLHFYSYGNSSYVMTIARSSGNVGIGTTAPNSKLEVAGGIASTFGSTNGYVALQAGSSTVQGYIEWFKPNPTRVAYMGYNDGVSANNLGLTLENSANFVINGGNVGIGTTAPGAKLHVAGAARITDNLTVKTTTERANITTDADLVTQNGVGVLSTSTSYGQGSQYIRFFNSAAAYAGSISQISATGIGLFSGASADLILGANITERMRITSAGNVGIGTTAPIDKLQVNGNLFVTSKIYNGSSNDSAGITFPDSTTRIDGFNGITFHASSTNVGSQSERMRITSAGNVLIGTTADTPLSTARGIVINSGASNDAQIRLQNNTTGSTGSDGALFSLSGTGVYLWNYENDAIFFGTNNSTRITITSAGNVGIGLTNPSSALTVVGDVRVSTGSLGVGVTPNATDGRIDASNDIVAFSTSDRRLKENITPIANALEKVKSLTGVEFDWKEETKSVHGYEGHDVGVIAQDVQAVLPEAVRTNDSGYLSVRYEKMIALLVEAMKEQQAQIDELKKLIK